MGGVFCTWSNSSSVTLSWGAVGCGTSGTCVAGAATTRTADGRFSGLVVGALSNSVSTAGVACPALIGVTPGKAGPSMQGTDHEEPPAAASLAPATGPDSRALDSDPGIGGGNALGPEPGIGRGAALGPDPGIGGGTGLGPEPGAGGANSRPDPACGNFGPEPEPPVGKGFGLEPGARFPDRRIGRPRRGAKRGRSAGARRWGQPIRRWSDGRSPQITDFLGDNRNILGPFPAIHAFLPDTDRLFWLERHDDLRRIGAAERALLSTVDGHEPLAPSQREDVKVPMRGVQPMRS